MQVANRHGQRVGGVVRRGRFRKAEQQLDHLLHLVLFGATVADHRALDLGAGVYSTTGQPALDRGQHGDAARVPELQRGAGVDGVKDRLSIATQSGWQRDEQRRELSVDAGEALWERDRAPGP